MRNTWILLLLVFLAVCAVTSRAQTSTSRAAVAASQPVVMARETPAFTQVTLAPTWGNRTAIAVPFVLNVNVRAGDLNDAAALAEFRQGFLASQRAGSRVGWYASANLLRGKDPYIPPTLLTPDPAWTPAMVRYAVDGVFPRVTLYEGGASRWELDTTDDRMRVRVAKRAAALYRERLAAVNRGVPAADQVHPDFLFLDNFGHRANGGIDDWYTFGDYAERLSDATELPLLINCSATPDDWGVDDWEYVAFLSETLRSEGRWLGVHFESAHRWVQFGNGQPLLAESSCYTRLLDLRVLVFWDAALSGIPDGQDGGAARLAEVAADDFRAGLGPYVGCKFWALPAWARQTRGP